MRRRTVTLIGLALAAAGTLLMIGGSLPYERLRSFGALVRRADDFTPERFARYRHVCWFFATVCVGLALVLWRAKPQARIVADARTGELRESGGWMLWLIVIIGVALRMQRLFDPVAYDEAYTYLNFASRPWYEAIGDYNSTNNHLLNTLLMHVSTRILGPQEWAMRWHVLLAGSVLPIAVFIWAKEWLGRPVGLIAAAAVAVSPMLITYSTDARGYMLVALAAIVFDLSLARLARDAASTEPLNPTTLEPLGLSPRSSVTASSDWWLAWGALVFGLCSMPLMVYAAAGSAAWFLIAPLAEVDSRRVVTQRAWALAGLGLLAVPAVAAFYAPAYVFRGLMFLRDPVVQPAPESNYLAELGSAWNQACTWWTEGLYVRWLWNLLAVFGFVALPSNASRLRWCLPFVVVLLLNVVQHVAPPPRIYMHLAPWIFLASALGFLRLLHVSRSLKWRDGTAAALSLLILQGVLHFSRPREQFDVNARADYLSVPNAIEAMQDSVDRHRDHRSVLLAPLPCDLPSIFYMRRGGAELPVNERPEPGDRVYLITRPGETPDDVLATPLVDMADLGPECEPWLRIEEFETLSLYVSQIPARR